MCEIPLAVRTGSRPSVMSGGHASVPRALPLSLSPLSSFSLSLSHSTHLTCAFERLRGEAAKQVFFAKLPGSHYSRPARHAAKVLLPKTARRFLVQSMPNFPTRHLNALRVHNSKNLFVCVRYVRPATDRRPRHLDICLHVYTSV